MSDFRKQKGVKIHIAKAQLGLSDDEYQAILLSVTGKASSKEMSGAELDAVLREMKRLGWQPAAPKPMAPPVGLEIKLSAAWMSRPSDWDDIAKNPSYKKIYAMICANKSHGWSWGYVRGTAKAMLAKSKSGAEVVLEFLDAKELHSLVSALAIHSYRLKGRAS